MSWDDGKTPTWESSLALQMERMEADLSMVMECSGCGSQQWMGKGHTIQQCCAGDGHKGMFHCGDGMMGDKHGTYNDPAGSTARNPKTSGGAELRQRHGVPGKC